MYCYNLLSEVSVAHKHVFRADCLVLENQLGGLFSGVNQLFLPLSTALNCLSLFIWGWETSNQEKSKLQGGRGFLSVIHSDIGLISRMHKELKIQRGKKTNNPVEKWAVDLNREISTEEMEVVKKYHKDIHHF